MIIGSDGAWVVCFFVFSHSGGGGFSGGGGTDEINEMIMAWAHSFIIVLKVLCIAWFNSSHYSFDL